MFDRVSDVYKNAILKVAYSVLELGNHESDLSYDLQMSIVRDFEDYLDFYGLEKVDGNLTVTERLVKYVEQLEMSGV